MCTAWVSFKKIISLDWIFANVSATRNDSNSLTFRLLSGNWNVNAPMENVAAQKSEYENRQRIIKQFLWME